MVHGPARFLVSLLLLGIPALASAEFYVCGDSNGLQQAFYRDPTVSRPGNCSAVAEGSVVAQVALIETVHRYDYLKVVLGLAVEKTQGEKDAVDAAIATQVAAIATLQSEVDTDTLCSETSLSAINAKLATLKGTVQTAIDVVTNVSTAKAALQSLSDTQFTIVQKTMRCLIALKRLGR